jgi:hypothetical protein
MCSTVWMADREISSQGDLAAVIPVEQWVWESFYGEAAIEPEYCMCPVDLHETFKRAGFRLIDHGLDYSATPDSEQPS